MKEIKRGLEVPHLLRTINVKKQEYSKKYIGRGRGEIQ